VVEATSLALWFFLAGSISIGVGISGFLIPSVMMIERGRPAGPQAGHPVPAQVE
jgi:hypothetical protein